VTRNIAVAVPHQDFLVLRAMRKTRGFRISIPLSGAIIFELMNRTLGHA
jgi:uncharacterized protein YtpQ (UPF0354 family)